LRKAVDFPTMHTFQECLNSSTASARPNTEKKHRWHKHTVLKDSNIKG